LKISKGVICKIEEPENMPVDIDGNRADIIMDANATISRMNLGRLHETFIGASARDTSKNIRNMLGMLNVPKDDVYYTLETILQTNQALFSNVVGYLLRFYELTSPKQFEYFSKISNKGMLEHLTGIVINGIYLYMPPDNALEITDVIRNLRKEYNPVLSPVTYAGYSGIKVTTEYNVRVAPIYVMLLEKIGDDWSSVASGKLQHYGILSPMTKPEKYSRPYRHSPVRTIGETEGRIFVSYCGRETAAEMMDRNNNPDTHAAVVKSLLTSDTPSCIYRAVDRTKIPLGNTKPLQIIKHLALVGGAKLIYEKE
jgi:hypothetical protein